MTNRIDQQWVECPVCVGLGWFEEDGEACRECYGCGGHLEDLEDDNKDQDDGRRDTTISNE